MAEEVTEEFDTIRAQMDNTRVSLASKLEALEERVKGTVESTKHSVEDTVNAAKQTVNETIQSVKQTFDLKYQVRRHPWSLIGCALFTGAIVAHLTTPKDKGKGRRDNGWDRTEDSYRQRYSGEFSEVGNAMQAEAKAKKPTALSRLMDQFHDELSKLQGVAIGAGLGMFRDWAKKAMPPSLASHIEQVIDSTTQKLGGERIDGPVFSRSQDRAESRCA